MRIRQLQWGDRGISVVIGTVLLVGIVTITMAVLATAILGTDFIDQSPEADIVYEEDRNGTVLIALADARGLSAENTELQLRGDGSCGSWDGDGTLGKGSVMLLEGSDCPDSLEEGDVIQVISSGTLVDTYELRGVSSSFDLCEQAIEDERLEIRSGDEIDCDLVSEDGGRVDVVLDMDGGELEGTVNLSSDGQLDLEGGTLDGDAESERFRLETDWTITGDLTVPATAESSSLTLKARTEVGGSVYSEGRSIELTDGVTVGEDVHITGTDEQLTLKSEAMVGGNVYVGENDVWMEPDSVIGGDVAGNEVMLKDGATIEGDATASTITCEGSATVEGTVDADENNGC